MMLRSFHLRRLLSVRPVVVTQQQREGSNRAKRGLYHERDVRFGNNISFAENKTRRKWKPNAQTKRLWSRILQCWLRFKLTTRALKCIEKVGGIDEYILFTPEKKMNSIAGMNAKKMLLSKLQDRDDTRVLDDVAAYGVGSKLYPLGYAHHLAMLEAKEAQQEVSSSR